MTATGDGGAASDGSGAPDSGTSRVSVACGADPSCHDVCCNVKAVPVCGGPVPCPPKQRIECDEDSDCAGGASCCGHGGSSSDFYTACEPSCKEDEIVCTSAAPCNNGESCSVRFELVLGVCPAD